MTLVAVSAALFFGTPWGSSTAPEAQGAESIANLPARPDVAALAGSEEKDVAEELYELALALQPSPPPAPAPTTQPAPTSQPAAPPASQPRTDVPPAPPPANPPPAAPGCPSASMSGYGLDLFNAINNERTSRGQPALAADGCVVYTALQRSNDMATNNYFSHTSPNGSSAFSLLDANGVTYGWAGENLARNNYQDVETVAVAIRDLMASTGHRDNILSGHYTALGVAAVNDGAGMWYYTMIFIGPP